MIFVCFENGKKACIRERKIREQEKGALQVLYSEGGYVLYELVMHRQSDITVQAQAGDVLENIERLRSSPRGKRATFGGRRRSDFSLLFATSSTATAHAILFLRPHHWPMCQRRSLNTVKVNLTTFDALLCSMDRIEHKWTATIR